MPDHAAAHPVGAPAFDAHAAGYDARTGLPPGAGEAVASAIIRLAGVGAGDPVLELGPGTGEIGVHLAALAPGYVGLDDSPAMLDIFRARAAPAAPRLLVADCNAVWPVPDASARLIFASRVIHLLDPDHVAREATRVCQPGGFLMLGRVQREPGSLKERLQRRRQAVLRERGMQPRQGEAGARTVIERCVLAGWEPLGRRVAAEWQGETSVAELLAGWEPLSRMGSIEVEPATRSAILTELRDWASSEIGEAARRESFHEQYVVDIIRLP